MEKKETKGKKKIKIYPFFLGLALLSFIGYTIIEVINYDNFKAFLPKLLGIIFIFLFLLCFIMISIKNKEKHGTIIIGSLLITIYSIINILLNLKVINLPSDEYVPNFYNKSITDVNNWKQENNIQIEEKYEYSDNIKKYYVISQDVLYPTLTKDIEKITIILSLGPDPEKEIIVPNFVGLSINDVYKFINENHLSNVKLEYKLSENKEDIVISQDKSGSMKRSDNITITLSKNETEEEIEIPDFTNQTELYATTWLNKYNFKYHITYEYNEKIDANYVISQDVKEEIKDPSKDEINLVVSKGRMILAPDIIHMSQDEINKWIMDNNLKVTYKEEYSDSVKLGDIISSSIKENDVANNQNIEITISKGALSMIKYTNINEFTNWAITNKVDYDIKYEASNTIKKDDLINCSHKEGQVIKKDDTVVLTISSGKMISIPNFIGMSKANIQTKCKSLNLGCSFKYGGYTEKTGKDIAINQSKKANTSVSEGTNIVITLSSGIIEKVNVPSFVGKTKSAITTQCKNIGITCNFNYQSGYSNTPKDNCVSQSKTGTVNKGSSITVTLSNGPAKTYTVIIDANQLSSGNPTATKNTLQTKLKNACPGVNFNFKFEKANSGIGYLSPNSQVKVGSNSLTQGKTYNVIINSN